MSIDVYVWSVWCLLCLLLFCSLRFALGCCTTLLLSLFEFPLISWCQQGWLDPSEVGEMRKTSEGGTQTAGQPGRLTFDAVEVGL